MAITLYLAISGNIPFLKAAGLNTGSADVNARYIDGYGTATATSSSKVYISDGSGYLPDGSVDAGAIVDGTIANADISGSAAIDISKLTGVRPTASVTTSISTSSMCNGARCYAYTSYNLYTCTKACIEAGYVSCYAYVSATCTSTGTTYYWNYETASWVARALTYYADCDGEEPGAQPCCKYEGSYAGWLGTFYCAR